MKIMVVEDEPLIRLGMVMAIEDAGYEVIEAANADEAVRKLERADGVKLVMTDVDMPGSMDGIKLAHFVRGRWPPIQLIVLSGKVGACSRASCRRAPSSSASLIRSRCCSIWSRR